ncbi:MAG: Two component transcriptional regulator, winged helix family [Synergistales bacterium 58_81]|nr:MAG: Two component transcriptional regulator, winged helix family [Synergistales bacterium 58_81]
MAKTFLHGGSAVERILLADDDTGLCELLTEFLEAEGFKVESIHDGRKVASRVLAERFSLVILDVMLPGLSGMEVLKEIRRQSVVPVLMLTARGDDVDRINRIDLTTVEFDLLETLAHSAGTAMSREVLVRSVLKRSFSPFDRSLDVHISNLRRKIGTYSDGSDRIKTVRGLGYILALPTEMSGQ